MEANNTKVVREALDNIVGIAKIALNVNALGNSNNSELWEIIDKCKSALATPPRNCDVGTAAEQYARFNRHCKARYKSDKPNPCGQADRASNPCAKCYSMWAQMPYEKKEESNVPDKNIP